MAELLNNNKENRAAKFRDNIRSYNSIFAFTSMGGNIDKRINDGRGPYVFRINGQNHHLIGSLLLETGKKPKFAQLYIYDTENEISNRIRAISKDNRCDILDPTIVKGLLNMFDTYNQLTKVFRMARDRFKESDLHDVHIRLIGNRGRDARQYNMPTTSEVAALIVGDLSKTNVERDVIVEHIGDGLQCISDLNPSFMAMQYQFCFLNAYTAIEEERLRWIHNSQPQLRAELYKGLRDAVVRGDTTPASVGRRIVSPSSFTGGPRYMVQNYQDAMAICRWVGNPNLFVTFTANPKWPEIQKFVDQIPGQKPNDRPDIESRVFKIKIDQLMRDLIKLQHFGRVIADKYPTPSEIDKILSAEIPDEASDYTAYAAVTEYMMHGPCGATNSKAPFYRRRDNDRFVQKGDVKLDNRYVVPHNVDLIIKYQAHINVEWCNRSRAIKYLFKYINKGPDRITIIVEEDISSNRGNDNTEIKKIDEIKSYLDCRYVSACACWRIFQFDIQHRMPAVERMAFHLPDEQCITFRDSEPINQVLNNEDVETTMFHSMDAYK
ncbi:uncharacterized protein LOC143855744 [Tasmannia lanceolata]|uniref:uncharacterized protein LOC143855744 n=1 Tax=Tasmannia lanceolata TaxID=3420 RepID=UPI0040647F67